MVTLIAVQNTNDDVNETFRLFRLREYRISSNAETTLSAHSDFFRNCPYRYWFFVEYQNVNVGTLYVQYDNSVGVNLIRGFAFLLNPALKELLKTVSPLDPIPSVRNANFIVNVPYFDEVSSREIEKDWGVAIQKTFKLCPKGTNQNN